jgi:hypothetical protein
MGQKKKVDPINSDPKISVSKEPDKKSPENDEFSDDGFQAITTSLKNITNNDHITKEITKYVNLFHIVVSDVDLFIRGFLIYYHDKYDNFCKIDQKFVEHCISIVTIKDNRGKKSVETELIKEMKEFYKVFKKETNHKPVSVKGVSYGLKYLAIDIITAIKNNVKVHFCKRLSKFIYIFASRIYKEEIKQDEDETDKEYSTKMNKEIFKLRKSVFEYDYDNIPDIFDELLEEIREYVLPSKINTSVSEYLSNNWSDFLPCMFYMIEKYEDNNKKMDKQVNKAKNETEKKELQKQKIKLFQCLPLRTENRPKFITIDTAFLIQMFSDDQAENKRLKELQHEIWTRSFNFNSRELKKPNRGKKFAYTIKTDGVGCSIMFCDENKGYKYEKKEKKNLIRQIMALCLVQ